MIECDGLSSGGIECVGVDVDVDGNSLMPDPAGNDLSEIEHHANLAPEVDDSRAVSAPRTTKGHGLRKWRRIRRGSVKAGNAGFDARENLKQDSSGLRKQSKLKSSLADVEHDGKGPIMSAEATCYDDVANGCGINGSDLESRLEESGSNSCGYDLPCGSGYVWEVNGTSDSSARTATDASRHGQQGRDGIEKSKKPRGGRAEMVEENSRICLESDSRGSEFVFGNVTTSAASDGRKKGMTRSCDGECNGESRECEDQSNREIQIDRSKGSGREFDCNPQCASSTDDSCGPKERSDFPQPLADRDPLIESLVTLQHAEKELEKEVKKFAGMREVNSEGISQSGPCSLEVQVLNSTEKVRQLEANLVEARANLKTEESGIFELEAAINGSILPKKESGKKSMEGMEIELEGLSRQMIEAEVEHLAIVRTVQQLRSAADGPVRPLEHQAAPNQLNTKMHGDIREVGNEIAMLKKQTAGLCGDILGMEGVLRLQIGACKVTACFVMQLILLVLAVWIFIMPSSPDPPILLLT